jgi:hypothetical protein
MTQYIQDNIPGMDEQLARIDQRDIDNESAQMHLARQFIKYGKWAKFSKDPEFKKRCERWRMQVAGMMGKVRQ